MRGGSKINQMLAVFYSTTANSTAFTQRNTEGHISFHNSSQAVFYVIFKYITFIVK